MVDEERAGERGLQEGEELGAVVPVGRRVVAVAAHGPRLVVVFDEDGVPPAVVDHRTLPFCHDAFEVRERPGVEGELGACGRVVVDVDDVEDEYHVEFFRFRSYRTDDLVDVVLVASLVFRILIVCRTELGWIG